MPSLFRFLALVGVLAGLTVGGMIALDTLVEPTPRDMSERIPPAKLRQ
ncbi:MAG: histidine kinase [Pseudomonadota bacterium]